MADDTVYTVVDGVDTSLGGPSSSFYEAGTVYEDIDLSTTYIDQALAILNATQTSFQPIDAGLTALATLNATPGLLVQTAADTFTKRTLTGTAGEVAVSNGDGFSGNPTVSLPAALNLGGKTVTGGTFLDLLVGVPSGQASQITLTAGSATTVLQTQSVANASLLGSTSLTPLIFVTNGSNRGSISASASDWTFGYGGLSQGTLTLAGATSGGTKLTALAAASGVLTVPSATDTLVGKATSDTFTNKTYDTAGTGNSLAIAGVAVTANTGTGAVVRAVSPAITTPTGIVKGDVGLGNVDNTTDIGKPVSTAQAVADALVASNAATATALKANIASPALTGAPTAPTASAGTGSTQIATTAYADAIGVSAFSALALKANIASPALSGVPTAPTAAVDTNSTQLATTAMVLAQAASATPLMNGAASAGASTRFARGDHIHPTDTTRAPLDSPALTGSPTAPTAAGGTNSNQVATTAFVVAAGVAGRPALGSNRTYYVRTDGSDSNTGLSNSSGSAFLTIQKAVDVASLLDIAGYVVTIQVADGTYTGAVVLKNVVGFAAAGNLVIQGNSATPANVVVSVTSNTCFSANGIYSIWDVKDLKIQTTTSGSGLSADNGASVRFGNLNFGACVSYHCIANNGATITCLSNYAISGGTNNHWYTVNGSIISVNIVTITLTGTPAFVQFAAAYGNASLSCYANTFSGAATGPRYISNNNGYIFTNGGGASYLPGNSAGSVSNGLYI